MSPAVAEAAGRVAKAVAARYGSRCWWVDKRDLEQQCWLIAAEVHASGGYGTDAQYGGMVWVACMRQLSRYVRRQQSAVSASDHAVKEMEDTHSGVDVSWLGSTSPSPYSVVASAEAKERVRQRIRVLLAGSPAAEAAALVLLDGYDARDVAEVLGVELSDVYAASNKARQIVKLDCGALAAAGVMREEG